MYFIQNLFCNYFTSATATSNQASALDSVSPESFTRMVDDPLQNSLIPHGYDYQKILNTKTHT